MVNISNSQSLLGSAVLASCGRRKRYQAAALSCCISLLSACSDDAADKAAQQESDDEGYSVSLVDEKIGLVSYDIVRGQKEAEAARPAPVGDEIAELSKQAAQLIEKQAELGDPQSAYRLALSLMANAHGSPDNVQAAKTWLAQAAEQGHVQAKLNLAGLLLADEATRPDAIALYEELAEDNHCLGVRYLASVEPDRLDIIISDVEAGAVTEGEEVASQAPSLLEKLELCGNQGDTYTQFLLAEYFLSKEERSLAIRWLARAARKGDSHAMRLVLQLEEDPEIHVPETLVAYVKGEMETR